VTTRKTSDSLTGVDWLGETVTQALSDAGVPPHSWPTRHPELLDQVMPSITEEFVLELKRSSTAVLLSDDRMAQVHRKEVRRLWARQLRALRLVVLLTHEIGQHVFHYVTAHMHQQPCLKEVLLRLCARGTQIGREAVNLLQSGYPDGASARWRTLHEIAITATFIARHGENTAERYLMYDAVDALAGARKYRESAKKYGLGPITDADFDRMEKTVEKLRLRYGAAFTKKNGWASHVLSRTPVRIQDIEENSGIPPVKSAYALASFNVHATPRGIMTRLCHDDPGELLAGPSVEGIGLPLRQTALDLGLLYTQLLAAVPCPTHRLLQKTLETFVNDVVVLPDPTLTAVGA